MNNSVCSVTITPPVAPSRKIADVGAGEAGDHAEGDADQDQPAEAIGEQIGGRAGRHDHGDDEARADGLQRRHRAGAQQGEEHDLQRVVLSPMLRAWFSSKNVTIRSFQSTARMASETAGDDRDLNDVFVGDRQDVAEHDGLDADRGRPDRRHQQAERKQCREYEADDSVLAQARLQLDELHAAGGQDPGEERADRKGRAEDIGRGDAGHDGMGQRVAHQRPALEHQIGREEGADAADQRAHPHRLQHVVVAEGHQQFGEQLAHLSPASYCCAGSACRRRTPAAARRRSAP